MKRLLYKTKPYTSPQGKPRVILICERNGFSIYSQSIFEDILSAVNCTVYYPNSEKEFDLDMISSDLSQMQLFVFAITKKLLSDPYKDVERLLNLAKEQHIPVLPLILEPIDLEEFKKKFGDMQYLDKSPDIEGAVSYGSQLSKYLTSVLVSDKVATEIRDSFDAYIFLSYRKKDCRYANELMRLIHKIDFCRDVAIWYDEFLVPGESFNTAIKETIRDCQVFALAVTPNMVNEQNYVMTVEYPSALELNKNMVAVEMVKTDPDELKKYYPSFPGCVDPNNEEELSDALKTALYPIPLRTDDSPEHLFYMGAAYLWGIDVEVDKERATELLTQASEKGNADASQMLSMMYRNGAGVALDYGKAINMQEHHISLLEKKSASKKSHAKTDELSQSILDLSELYELNGNLKAQTESLKKVIALSDKSKETEVSPYKMESLLRLGKLADRQGKDGEAENYYTEAQKLSRQYSGPDKAQIAPYSIRSNLLLANLSEKNGNLDQAKQRYKEAVAEWNKNCKDRSFSKVMESISSHLEELEGKQKTSEYLDSAKQKITAFKDQIEKRKNEADE